MLSKLSWKKISQTTATTVFGIAMLAAVGTAKANAAQLNTFNISGTFDFQVGGDPELPKWSSFDGTYTVNVDQLSNPDGVGLENWDVNIRYSNGSIQPVFTSDDFPASVARAGTESLNFFLGNYTSFTLFVDSTKTNTGTPVDYPDLGVPIYGYFESYDQQGYVTSVYNELVSSRFVPSEPVPESFTLGGTVVASAMGWWLRRKRKASQAV
ncbi:hypothetical protein [Nostoc sp. MG11]|uniref:hypothetical protein n=1 Tax=Nostoc sp. MG11 TaxID=2721166 RepID=UPI001866BECF|nr:hypothetical protein [Nostoc sp. MG11]